MFVYVCVVCVCVFPYMYYFRCWFSAGYLSDQSLCGYRITGYTMQLCDEGLLIIGIEDNPHLISDGMPPAVSKQRLNHDTACQTPPPPPPPPARKIVNEDAFVQLHSHRGGLSTILLQLKDPSELIGFFSRIARIVSEMYQLNVLLKMPNLYATSYVEY